MSASASVRASAARIVAQVASRGRSLDELLSAHLPSGHQGGSSQERGLLRALTCDSIRWYLRLDALLARLLATPRQRIAPEIHALAIVGLCQLLYTDIPAHAAVDETVNATRLLGQPRAAGLINAVLRRCQREHRKLLAELDRDCSIRTAHPQWLIDALEADWGARADAILDANNQRPPFWVRVNRRRSSGTEYRALLAAQGMVVSAAMFADEALLLERAVDVHELPGFTAGQVSVQDAAAQLAARLMAPLPGERLLDACAAPGGKTCHLLELQPELAEVVAVDVAPDRLERVAQNLHRLDLQATLLCADAAAPATWWDRRPFDRILLDVPCSATGVIRRHPDIKLLRRVEDIPAFAARQSQLLDALWPLLAPGGRIVYASCSSLRAEGSAIVQAFLARCPQASDATTGALAAIGIGGGMVESGQRGEPGCRIAAGTSGMDGFYYACLEKMKG